MKCDHVTWFMPAGGGREAAASGGGDGVVGGVSEIYGKDRHLHCQGIWKLVLLPSNMCCVFKSHF